MIKAVMIFGAPLLLTACVSFGEDAPPALLTLTAAQSVSAGTSRTAAASGDAILIDLPDAERKLDTQRVPVQTDDSSIAYLADAIWVDRPARLFRNLLEETIAAKTGRLVLAVDEVSGNPALTLSGRLVDFGYDARTASAVVTYDAIRKLASGAVERRRFMAREPVSAPMPAPVGQALNKAANTVAGEVAVWIGG